MGPYHPKFLVDEDDIPQAVVLTLEEWNDILDELEELEDIRAEEGADSNSAEAVPFDEAVAVLDHAG